MQSSEDVYIRNVLIEKMIKMSYLVKKQQFIYRHINVIDEYRALLIGYDEDDNALIKEPSPGYYMDSDFLNDIIQ